jgi:hypothetical protein
MKSHQGDSIPTHVTLSEQELDGPLGLCQPIKRRRTRCIHNKNRGRRGTLYPAHDPEIIGAYLDPGATALAPTKSLPWHRCPQGRDQIKAWSPSRIASNRPIGPPSTRIGSNRSDPSRALLRRGTAARLPRICGLRQQTRRQGGANCLEYHFSQRLTVVNRIGSLIGIARVRIAALRLTGVGLTRIR